MRNFRYALAVFSPILLWCGLSASGQSLGSSGTITGTVFDLTGAVIPNAQVEIRNPVSNYSRKAQTDAAGNYQFNNVPFSNYHTTVKAAGFAPAEADVIVRSGVPVPQQWKLEVAASSTTVTVEADAGDLLDQTPTQHTNLDSSVIEKIPTQGSSSGLSSLLSMATPGVASDSNGLFHPQGEHSDTSYSVDGQPISDQQSRQFSNQIALSSVQSLEVINGVAPAEYGDKASLVVKTVTKSGLGMGKPHGSISAGYGSFGTSTPGANIGFGSATLGSFTAIEGIDSGRFLDSPELGPLHDHGNSASIFQRLDYQANQNNSVHLNLSFSRSWTQIPNQYDQNALGQDQKQQIKSFNISPTYTHLFNQHALMTANLWLRQDQVHYYPSKNPFSDTPATLTSTRRLTNLGIKTDFSYDRGIHNFKTGATFQHTPLSEAFSIGITDPAYNAPCLNSSGAPIANPSVTLPCSGPGQQKNPGYQPGQAAYDLTRGGSPASFGGSTDVKEESLYVQDEVHAGNWTASGGIRADNYNGIVSRSMVQPRAGLSYNVKKTGTVLSGSYGKFFLTPYNENLIVSSSTGLGGLAANAGAFGQQPLRPSKRNQFDAGFQQAFGKYVAVSADYFWKFTARDYDFDVLLNTPLAFPIEWRKSKIDGYAIRVNLTSIHGVTAYSVLGHTRSRFFGPEIGGIISNDPALPTSGEPFRIDHDQNFQQTTHLQWQPKAEGFWYGFNWNYESGGVAGNAPFAADTTTPVSLTYLTADQQAQIQLTCGGVVATLTAPLTSCAPSQLSSPLLRLPAPGTQNPDRNPARVAPRNLFDMATGWDNLFHRDKYKASLNFTVTNLTNKAALYNFLSTFSGTHFVSPRSYQASLTLSF